MKVSRERRSKSATGSVVIQTFRNLTTDHPTRCTTHHQRHHQTTTVPEKEKTIINEKWIRGLNKLSNLAYGKSQSSSTQAVVIKDND
jgi:hypothetical protein